jgi:hypothetical protein
MLVVCLATSLSSLQDIAFVGIIPGAFVLVGEDLVGDLDFGEEGCGTFDVTEVAIGMQLECLLAVCSPDSVA